MNAIALEKKRKADAVFGIEMGMIYRGIKMVDGALQYLVKDGQGFFYQASASKGTLFEDLRSIRSLDLEAGESLVALDLEAGESLVESGRPNGALYGAAQCESFLQMVNAFDSMGRLHGYFFTMAWGDPRRVDWSGNVPRGSIQMVQWFTNDCDEVKCAVRVNDPAFCGAAWDGEDCLEMRIDQA